MVIIVHKILEEAWKKLDKYEGRNVSFELEKKENVIWYFSNKIMKIFIFRPF